MSESRAFSNLVVVGSSAGGIDALSRVLGSLPVDFSAPVVIAQHTHPERESHLEEILSRRSSLPVRTVTEGAPLAAGTVFVVPADRHVSITEKEIDVHEDGHGRPKPSIDLLMSTASEVYGENLIAVVLSGSGSDGADGARAVKAAGGTVVVQDPESAEFSGMPGSLAPNTIDIVSELDGIGSILSGLLEESAPGPSDASGDAGEQDEEGELTEFLEELREHYGVDFRDYKRPTIRRRLARRFIATGSGDLAGYRRYLEENPEEYRRLVNSFLIKVTEFFRDPDQFGHLKAEVLPRIIGRAREQGEQIRVWSAGCATGEEAYSLAILLSDVLEESADGGSARQDVRIFATDLDESAVDHARRGVYPASALSALTEEQVSRYFEEIGGLYYVSQTIRSMIIFGEHDLAQRSPFPRLDLVMSRNVLIYFTPELQRRTLQLFAFSLKDNGYLMLGKSESTSPLAEHFAAADRKHNVFRRQGERIVMPVSSLAEPVPHPPRGPAHGRRSLRAPETFASGRSARREPRTADSGQAALETLPVGVVTVDGSYDIRSINAAARRMLSVHGQGVGEDLLHLVREAPYDELRAAIDSAFRGTEDTEDTESSSAPPATSEFDTEEVTTGRGRTLRMTCHPPADSARSPERSPEQSPEHNPEQTGDRDSVRTVTIVVEDVTESSREKRELRRRLDSAAGDHERRREQNARLIDGNTKLEETNQDLRRVVEELRSSNEDHQLAAEEAQASAEEVETLNEEMQATNEELETVNEELQATIEELNTTNEDLRTRTGELQDMSRASEQEREQLKTILEGIPEAVVVVEASGETMFTNEAYRLTFPDGFVASDDLGNELSREQSPQGRAASGETFTMEITAVGPEGTMRRYETKGSPVGDRRRRGGVIVFRELSARGADSGSPA